MTNHPDDGRLQTYLDGELSFDGLEAVERHLLSCEPCRERVDALREREARVKAALAQLDRQMDAEGREVEPEAALWRVRQARARRRSATRRRRLATAATVVLLLGAGAAAAMPGSPLRSWIAGDDEPVRVETAEVETEGAALSFQLRDGEGRVEIVEPGDEVELQLRLAQRAEVHVAAPPGASFETGPGWARITGGHRGALRVELPMDARRASVTVDQRSRVELREGVLEVDGREVDPRQAADDEGWISLPRAPDGGDGGRDEGEDHLEQAPEEA